LSVLRDFSIEAMKAQGMECLAGIVPNMGIIPTDESKRSR
jgi:hypothetical protein